MLDEIQRRFFGEISIFDRNRHPLDNTASQRATQSQIETHKAIIRSRWMPAWIDNGENGKFGRATVTATLFGGMDESLYVDFQKGTQVVVNEAENTLKHAGGAYGPAHMASKGSILKDLTIAVQEKREVPSFGWWSAKDGIPHVQPPALVLEPMITLRIHLDDSDASNGALKVIPDSQREGKLAPSQVESWRLRNEPVTCEVRKGGVLLMRPLLLHSSSPASNPGHRRVVHFEYAAGELPGGLR